MLSNLTGDQMDQRNARDVEQWLVDKIAIRAEIDPAGIGPDQYFDEFALDSTEALVLAGELEEWLGFEIPPTTLWYYPTIALLAEHVADQAAAH